MFEISLRRSSGTAYAFSNNCHAIDGRNELLDMFNDRPYHVMKNLVRSQSERDSVKHDVIYD